MRLIDANALIQKHGYDVTNWDKPCAVFISSIKNAPTIDPEDLRPTSRLELRTKCSRDYYGFVNVWVCTHCGFDIEDRSKQPKRPEDMNYCPNCGADMRERTEEPNDET